MRFDSLAKFLGEISSTGRACIFVRMYTCRLSFQWTSLRIPLTRIVMPPFSFLEILVQYLMEFPARWELLIMHRVPKVSSAGMQCKWHAVSKHWRKISIPTRKGHFPYKSPLNSCIIYQFATDNVKSNTTVKCNTCSFDNKCCKNCGLLFITNPPLSHICQSTTTRQYLRRTTLLRKLPRN
jgi:hypothetical protein